MFQTQLQFDEATGTVQVEANLRIPFNGMALAAVALAFWFSIFWSGSTHAARVLFGTLLIVVGTIPMWPSMGLMHRLFPSPGLPDETTVTQQRFTRMGAIPLLSGCFLQWWSWSTPGVDVIDIVFLLLGVLSATYYAVSSFGSGIGKIVLWFGVPFFGIGLLIAPLFAIAWFPSANPLPTLGFVMVAGVGSLLYIILLELTARRSLDTITHTLSGSPPRQLKYALGIVLVGIQLTLLSGIWVFILRLVWLASGLRLSPIGQTVIYPAVLAHLAPPEFGPALLILWEVGILTLASPVLLLLGLWVSHLQTMYRAESPIPEGGRPLGEEYDFVPDDIEVIVSPTPGIYAYATHRIRDSPKIVLGADLVSLLDDDEVRAVVAHETQHSVESDIYWPLVSRFLGLFVGGPNVIIALADFPRRELAADRFAAAQVGVSPFASALRKIEAAANRGRTPDTDAALSVSPEVSQSVGDGILRRRFWGCYSLLFSGAILNNTYRSVSERIKLASEEG